MLGACLELGKFLRGTAGLRNYSAIAQHRSALMPPSPRTGLIDDDETHELRVCAWARECLCPKKPLSP